ncbi:MAG TPA: hypothetical protein DCS07_07440 [Bdellovibrionales bacterium]|nr:MAG: hypothetical protein A2Z97_07910 [Bdellovibrionales bacterium GWB1_52_6]OFZ03116.1 MAG: hypothetical protein A2X97_09775 [Bdellovibrionales bacterium GWA1_52_35]OFZ36838.1 MAG: hypothetical protein A2070_06875 [Bdellovibrionales bacterium GWC1_52_8]HAR42452.1 hypothetical protein [Bdellovibrionales bacterium]HCM40443.1 hypothetical protein [Bdellovibrionales bacterium]
MKKAKSASKKSPAKKKTSVAKKAAAISCTSPLCKLMTSAKGRAFGRAGEVFYTEYLKIMKKKGDKEAMKALAPALVEMSAMAQGKICACDTECGTDEKCADGCDCNC